jgi:hypothetical protein
MNVCPICNSTLRINGSHKKVFDIDPVNARLVTYQNQTCMNAKSVDAGGAQCPNYGLTVNTIEHEEVIEKA